MIVFELDNLVRGGEPLHRTRGIIASRVKMVTHPRGSYVLMYIYIYIYFILFISLALLSRSLPVETQIRSHKAGPLLPSPPRYLHLLLS